MWYENTKGVLDFSKPIFATHKDAGVVLLLIPQHIENGYTIVGYDWLKVKEGTYNSRCRFESPQLAIEAYKSSYNFTNDELKK
ncbi:MAG: hypothetical protein PHW73_13605 [Atribacterota bacterium]|nr:hypothetical protein [Atribacterota bacterium]